MAAMTTDAREALAEATIFENLAAAQIDQLAAIAVRKRYGAREVVLRKGDPALQLFVIASGRLKAISEAGDGRHAGLSIMGPGEVFGEIALLDGEPRSATITTLERCELFIIGRNDFLHFLERSPGAAIELLRVLAQRVRRLSERVEDHFRELPGRLARLLARLAEDHGIREPGGAVRIDLKLSQQELADLVGASRESVNKQLRAWVAEGWLEQRKGRLVICDPGRLEAQTGS
jgi:CRP/FNR family transcriptional regulator, cyclic AMP receptor protein